MIIDFIIEDLMLNSYLQKNFHTLAKATTVIDAKISFRRVYTVARYPQKNKYTLLFGTL